MGYALGGRVGAMRRSERVVDVHVSKGCQPLCERRIVRLLAGLEADVLQHGHVAVAQCIDNAPGVVANHVVRHRHRCAEQLAEPRRHRRHPQRVVDAPLGTAQVRDHDHPRAAIAQCGDGGQRGPDAPVVDHAPVAHGNVEVLAEQHGAPADVGVVQSGLGHKRAATYSARSTTRQE